MNNGSELSAASGPFHTLVDEASLTTASLGIAGAVDTNCHALSLIELTTKAAQSTRQLTSFLA